MSGALTARWLAALQAIVLTAWVGALWTTGLLTAPVLFDALPDRTLAGTVAGRLFEATALIGVACGATILLIRFVGQRAPASRDVVSWLVVTMLVLALAGQFGVAPVIAGLREQAYPQPIGQTALGDTFAFWHGVAAVLYLGQCLLAAALVVIDRLVAFRVGTD